MKHTPGPWEVRRGEPWVIAKAYGNMKSVVHLNLPVEQSESQKADARLIAAAPDLLEAAKHALETLDSKHNFQSAEWRHMHYLAFEELKNAIAKATGETR